jgi:hypothetical protein
VQALLTAATDAVKSKNYVQADKSLNELEPLLVQKPVTPTPPATPPPPPAPPAQDSLQAEWERRVTDLEPRVLDAQKKRAGEAKWMTLFTSLQEKGFDGDFASALKIADRLEALLAASPSPTEQAPTGLVNYRKALLQYREARKTVDGQLANLQKTVAGTLPAEAETAARVVQWLAGKFAPIDAAIDDAINAAQDARAPYNEATRALLKKFVAELGSDRMVKHVDANPVVPVAVHNTLVAVLTAIQGSMV